MKRLLCAVMLVVAGGVSADQLSDANKLLMAKAYDQALPIYTKLANAGNAEAQFRLGEMYWYGDGTAVDMAMAAAWFKKAAAAGSADAKESLAILDRRAARGAEITHWTGAYKGDDLTSGKFDCKAPVIPAMSKTNDEIKATSAAIAAWESCYNDFVANLNDAMPPGKRIPADVVEMMSPREIEQAQRHLDGVYGKVAANAQGSAGKILAQRDAWRSATEKFVADQNSRTESDKTALLIEQQRLRTLATQQRNAPSGPTPVGH